MKRAFWRTSVQEEVDAELAFHLEMTTRELMESGMTRSQARAEAERRFGDARAVNDECRRYGGERDRKRRRAEYLDELRQDVSFSLRQLAKARTFSVVAIVTLALGIGATASVFSTLDAVVLRPLPFDHAERVVELQSAQRGDLSSPAVPEFLALRSSNVFETVSGAVLGMGLTVKIGDVPEILGGARVSADYFDIFKVRPQFGRGFTAAEDAPGGAKVTVLSHRLWTERFNQDRGVIGRTIQLDGEPATVIGIMPASFDFTSETEELWIPLQLRPEQTTNYSEHFLRLFARLRPGQTVDQAHAAATAVERAVVEHMPARQSPVSDFSMSVTGFQDQLVGGYAGLLLELLGAVALVLLIACTNVAHLLLARGTARARELAIRAALGAGRGRLTRQLLTESLVLGLSGAIASLAVAYGLLKVILRVSPEGIPRLDQASIDWRVLGFTLALGLVSCLLFGLLPALRAAGPRTQSALRDGGRSGAGFSRERLRGALVAMEVSLAITLLVASGLLIRSAWLIQRVDPGWNPRGLLAARLMLPAAHYGSAEAVTRAYAQIREDATHVPGVAAVALASTAPMTGMVMASSVVAANQPRDDRAPSANVRIVSPAYFSTLGIPLRAGRDIALDDTRRSPDIAVINEALARRLWPDVASRDVVGRYIDAMGKRDSVHLMEVVGIAADIREEDLRSTPKPTFYVPVAQAPAMIWPLIQRSLVVMVKSATPAADADALVRPLGRVIASFDASLPIADARTMEHAVQHSMATERMSTLLLSLLGGIALALAVVGIYGVVAYFVTQRTQEIGLRMALGATHGRIWRFVVRRGVTPIVAGLVLGIGLSMVTTGALRGQLYGVSPHDPITLAGVAGLLMVVGLIATYGPARRAMRVPPAVALMEG